jgi:hypothetical protein
VGLSHFDLDTLGGCLAVLGQKPENSQFWEAAEYVDLNGPHALKAREDVDKNVMEALHAFWAWSVQNRLFPPRDGSAVDCTEHVHRAAETITRILAGDEKLLEAGREFAAKEAELNSASFVEAASGVVVRVAAGFTNHLYNTPDGLMRSVVAYNTKSGAITVSFADDDARGKLNACEIVQKLWGKEAGGHAGIAGSPRGTRMNLDDLYKVVEAVRASME